MKFFHAFLIALVYSAMVFAQEEKKSPAVSGWGWMTLGQVQKSERSNKATIVDFNKKWLTDVQAGIKVTAPVSSRSVCKVHLMGSMAFPVVNVTAGADNAEPLQKSFSVAILEASMKTNWEISDNDTITNEFGYFPVKYNADAMNLGEYLFRSNAYPALVSSGFEVADKVKLAGVHTGYSSHTGSGNYKMDMYINTETEHFPTYDISFSYIAGYSTPKTLFDMSAGVSFFHLIAFDEQRITPGKSSAYNTVATSYVDTASGDTTDYTFRGTKLAGRLTIDPKAFFNARIFGKNDLKIYAEAAVLGVRNYPGWYQNLRERIPVMVGVNLPAFRILDVLAIEFEYYPNPYMNAYQFLWKSNSPVPYFETNTGIDYTTEWKKKTDDDWKWSVYASKKIGNVRISGQIASDHSSRASYLPAGKKLYTEMVPRTQDWYFMLRCGFFF